MKNLWQQIFQYILAAVIVLVFAVAIVLLMKSEISQSVKDPLLVLLGVLGASFKDVVGYFFGSSKSSADKNEMLNKNNM